LAFSFIFQCFRAEKRGVIPEIDSSKKGIVLNGDESRSRQDTSVTGCAALKNINYRYPIHLQIFNGRGNE